MGSGDQSRSSSRLRAPAAALLAIVAAVTPAAALASAAPPRLPTLTPAEQLFAKRYRALIPSLDKASAALITAFDDASKYSNAQVVTVFTAVAAQWASATKPLLALSAPAQVASIFATIVREVPAIEADLLAVANSGRTQNGSAATRAGHRLAVDYNVLGTAVGALKKKLSLP